MQLIGWLGNIFIVMGLWKIGDKVRNAFIYSIIGESFWIFNALTRHDWALATICCVFNGMAIRNYQKWGKNV